MERIYRLHDLLSAGKPITAPKLAQELGTSPSTIRRMLAYMRDRLRAPLDFDPVANTHFYLRPFTTLPRLVLTEAEAAAFSFACSVSSTWRSSLARQMQSVLRKMEPLIAGGLELPYETVRQAIDLPESIDLAEYRFLDVVFEAKLKRHELRLEYLRAYNAVPEIRERIHPLVVRRFDQSWVLLAWDLARQDYRTFKFCRMRGVQRTGAKFTAPEDFDEKECMRGNLGCYTGREHHTVRIALWGAAATEAMDHKWHTSQLATWRTDGGIEITLELNNLVDVTYWILKCGPEAEALQPLALRERVSAAIEGMRARYAKTGS
jgi:predicted DNA-binding transcriptional regulator YafY